MIADRDLQGLVQRLRDVSNIRAHIVDARTLMRRAADAIERLSAQRGTCSSCRFWERRYGREYGYCSGPAIAAIIDCPPGDAVTGQGFGCVEYESQPTATEEASK